MPRPSAREWQESGKPLNGNGNGSGPSIEDQLREVALATDQAVMRAATAAHECTDAGNARRFAAREEGKLLYVPEFGWHVWDGRRWKLDKTGEERRRVQEMAASLYDEANRIRVDAARFESKRDELEGHAKKVWTWAKQTEGGARMREALDWARSDKRLVAEVDTLDAHEHLLNTRSGTLNLNTLEPYEHAQGDRLTLLTGARFDPAAKAPRWERFLEEIIPDPEVRAFMQRAVGESLRGRNSEHMLILWGDGANGKSTFIRGLTEALGDYASITAPDVFIRGRGEMSAATASGLSDLRGTRLAATTETEEGQHLAESTIKWITGEPTMKVRRMRKDWFEIRVTSSLFMATNNKPELQGADGGLRRRVLLVPFTVYIKPENRDENLVAKLAEERDGILAWALRGLQEFREQGLNPPRVVRQASEEYMAEQDLLIRWMDERLELDEGAIEWSEDIWRSYAEFMQLSRRRPIPRGDFDARLRRESLDGPERLSRGGERRMAWKGARLIRSAAATAGPSLD